MLSLSFPLLFLTFATFINWSRQDRCLADQMMLFLCEFACNSLSTGSDCGGEKRQRGERRGKTTRGFLIVFFLFFSEVIVCTSKEQKKTSSLFFPLSLLPRFLFLSFLVPSSPLNPHRSSRQRHKRPFSRHLRLEKARKRTKKTRSFPTSFFF